MFGQQELAESTIMFGEEFPLITQTSSKRGHALGIPFAAQLAEYTRNVCWITLCFSCGFLAVDKSPLHSKPQFRLAGSTSEMRLISISGPACSMASSSPPV